MAVQKGGNEWLEADAPAGSPEDLEELTQEVRRIRPAAVVVDSPHCGPDYLAELVALGPLVVSIDTAAAWNSLRIWDSRLNSAAILSRSALRRASS